MSDNADSASDHQDDGWEDCSSCVPRVRITAEYVMAGGGSHAWSYVLEWKNRDDEEPTVFVRDLQGKEKQDGQTLIVRSHVGGGCEDFRLVPFGSALPEETDEFVYHRMPCPDF